MGTTAQKRKVFGGAGKSLLGVFGLLVAAGVILGLIGGCSKVEKEEPGAPVRGAKEAGGGPMYAVLAYNFNVQDSDFPADVRKDVLRDRWRKVIELKGRPWLYANKLVIGVVDVGEDHFKDGFHLDFSDAMLPLALPRLPHNGWRLHQVVPKVGGMAVGSSTDYIVIVEKGGLDGKGQ